MVSEQLREKSFVWSPLSSLSLQEEGRGRDHREAGCSAGMQDWPRALPLVLSWSPCCSNESLNTRNRVSSALCAAWAGQLVIIDVRTPVLQELVPRIDV